jgi:hypothetical protein
LAILQISRIQVRRGYQEELPQLAGAEFGWAMDSRRLYIGNGTLEEGAPTLGNTEILTEYSDIFTLSGIYTFKGEQAGYTVRTGPTRLAPSSRSMQDKFDDFANIRDFGAIGDGVANDVEAFNRAITELYKKEIMNTVDKSALRIRRTIYVPAGTYKLTGDFIRLLPYVKLRGDGKNATVIIQDDSTQPCVISTADSEGRTGLLLNDSLPNVTTPGYAEAADISFVSSSDKNDILQIDSASNLLFVNVKMEGVRISNISLSNVGTNQACVNIMSSRNAASNLTFMNCDFNNQTYGFYTNSQTTAVTVIGGSFSNLYRGLNLGESNTGSPGAGNQVSCVKVSHAVFDNIYQYGIYASRLGNQASGEEGVTNVVSAFNTFKNVGYSLVTSTAPQYPAVYLGGRNSYSIGDTFDRADGLEFGCVDLNGRGSFAILPNGRFTLGKQNTVGGEDIVLTITATPVLAGVIGEQNRALTLEYAIIRSDKEQRTGQIKVSSINDTNLVYDDDYVETTDLGVELTPVLGSTGVIELYYTTTLAATLKTSSRTLI